MSKKEKPLPMPPKTPFGMRHFADKEENAPLMTDRMAAAMAEGKLDEFIKEEMPDNKYARALAEMMMGMTGMTPWNSFPLAVAGKTEDTERSEDHKRSDKTISGIQVPEDVIRAAGTGDVRRMMEALEREHKKRMTGTGPVSKAEERPEVPSELSGAEKETLDQLIKIASENSVSIDWIVSRALAIYVKEYQRTGRL